MRGKGKWRAKGMQSAVVLSHGDRGTPSPPSVTLPHTHIFPHYILTHPPKHTLVKEDTVIPVWGTLTLETKSNSRI